VLPPFSHLGWEITGELAAFLFHLVRRHRPKVVLELGSGSSTILFAAAARANAYGRVISVEHDAEHRSRTAQYLQDAELSDWVTLVETPLVIRQFGDHQLAWYDLDLLLRGMTEKIDLLFVDGPPGRLQPLSRYPRSLSVAAPGRAGDRPGRRRRPRGRDADGRAVARARYFFRSRGAQFPAPVAAAPDGPGTGKPYRRVAPNA
jgi:hypothetical protein